jgi:hypothetical protein
MPLWTNIGTNAGGRFYSWRTRVSAFPAWGKPILFLAALPGLAIALLSIVLLGASLLALLLLVLPVYKLIRSVAAVGGSSTQATVETEVTSPGSKTVSVRILDS